MRTDWRAEGDRRSPKKRTPGDYEELLGAFDDAERLLGAGETRDADGALKRAGVKAAAMWGGVGTPALPGPVRELTTLAAAAQDLLAHADGAADTGPLLARLGELRAIFEREARSEADGRVDGAR